jgi:small-conductance mechanosensitive channel
VELPVGVAYGTDSKLVKELLERPAIQHADVLTAPPPVAYFTGFGDSSLNFELQFWVMQESNTVRVKSEVALEVMRLLAEAGIEIPFPQRDLRLRAVDAEAAAALAGEHAEREEFRPRIKSAAK